MNVKDSISKIESVAGRFEIEGRFAAAQPHGNGHIHRTYRVVSSTADAQSQYILQKINTAVFQDPVALMENIFRVTEHLRAKAREGGLNDLSRRVLTVVSTREGEKLFEDVDGGCWRMYLFVDRTVAYDFVAGQNQAKKLGQAFGGFQAQMLDLPGRSLAETIRDFHDTSKRVDFLEEIIARDPENRAKLCTHEIETSLAALQEFPDLTEQLRRGELPGRVTHNDTKLNNILFDRETDEAICVIDLDTVMPGSVLFDFGDMVRTGTRRGAEDERDLATIEFDLGLFEGLLEGYLEAAGSFLSPLEQKYLKTAGPLITFENGVRFLTDFLEGDRYFKTTRRRQNLERCRAQFRLLQSMQRQQEGIASVVDRLLSAI